jgi:hypothetical protein
LLFSVQYPWSFLIEKQQNGEKIFTDENWRWNTHWLFFLCWFYILHRLEQYTIK